MREAFIQDLKEESETHFFSERTRSLLERTERNLYFEDLYKVGGFEAVQDHITYLKSINCY